jgi:hypothetical protein
LTDQRLEARLVAAGTGVALRIGGRDLFDVLAMDVELLQSLFARFLEREDARPAVVSAAR